jgi:hypothetical protein
MSDMQGVHREAMADYRATVDEVDRYIERDEIIPWATWIKQQRRDEGVYDLMDRLERGEYGPAWDDDGEYEGVWLERQDARDDG